MRFHTNLPVQDIEQTQTFYAHLFGVAPSKRKTDYVKFVTPQLNIAFTQSKTPPATGLHLGFEVLDPETLRATWARLEAAGLPLESMKSTECCYALQDKFWVTDPSGYRWEIYRILDDIG